MQTIANFINAIIDALKGIVRIADNLQRLSDYFGLSNITSVETQSTPSKDTNDTSKEDKTSKSGKHPITLPENVSAHFWSTGSPAWASQPGGKHWGTDYAAPQGSAVYAPVDMKVVKIDYYGDKYRRGYYIIGKTANNAELYFGHLERVFMGEGESIRKGEKIGAIGSLNHTHVQLRVNDELYDYEKWEG